MSDTDVTRSVVFLASDESRYVTGLQLRVNAGAVAKQTPLGPGKVWQLIGAGGSVGAGWGSPDKAAGLSIDPGRLGNLAPTPAGSIPRRGGVVRTVSPESGWAHPDGVGMPVHVSASRA